jgi:hypothetical protein
MSGSWEFVAPEWSKLPTINGIYQTGVAVIPD